MKKRCNYCDETIEYHHRNEFSSHRVNCRKAPFYDEKRRKISKGMKVWLKSGGIETKPYRLVCERCKETFIVNMTEYAFSNRKEPYRRFCSHSCANYRIGSSDVLWYEYGNIKVHGTYELRACHILDQMKNVGEIKEWDYTGDNFIYFDEKGNKHRYYIDFKINREYYLEIKGYKFKNDHLKWDAVRSYGYRLDVWFCSDLKNFEKMYGILVL